MAQRLLFRACLCVEDEQRGGGRGRAADHVLQQLLVARRVDDHELAFRSPDANARRIKRDRLIALGLEAVEHE